MEIENKHYKGAKKKYATKSKAIKVLMKTNFKDLTIKNEFTGKSIMIGDKTKKELKSFSSLVSPLNSEKFASIPKKNLIPAAEFGKNVMEYFEIEHTLGKDGMVLTEYEGKILKVVEALNGFFDVMGWEKIICEKYWVNISNKTHGFIDFIMYDKNKNENILIELKVRSKSDIGRFDRMQAAFYKSNFNNIKSYVVCINKTTLKIEFEEISYWSWKRHEKTIYDYWALLESE